MDGKIGRAKLLNQRTTGLELESGTGVLVISPLLSSLLARVSDGIAEVEMTYLYPHANWIQAPFRVVSR